METKNKQQQEQFVLHHYRPGQLDTKKALARVRKRLGHSTPEPATARVVGLWATLRRYAAVVALVLVTAGAFALFLAQGRQAETPPPAPVPQAVQPPTAEPHTFHFENAPIGRVLAELSAYYGVELSASDTTRRLTGDFEAEDLGMMLDMIGQTLDITITPQAATP